MGFDVKITTFSGILDLAFPHTCRGCGRLGEVLCECCKNYNIQTAIRICARCKKLIKKCNCEVPIIAVAWREGLMQDLIEEYKYQAIRDTARVLAEMLDSVIPKDFLADEVVVVPLPTVSKHIRERGFDHTLKLAKELTKIRKKGAKWRVDSLLERNKNSVQVGASEKQRKLQAKTAYKLTKVAQKGLDSKRGYLLLDDVYTTGASIEAAISLMKKAGAKKLAAVVVVVSR